MTQRADVVIDVWSDYVCPYCYLEIPVLEELFERTSLAVHVRWHAFELRPHPGPTLEPDGAYLRRVWASSVYPLAEARGLALRLPPVQPYSKQALAAAEYAKTTPHFDAFHRGLFQTFFEDGRDISKDGVIFDVAEAAGLDGRDVVKASQDSRYSNLVDADRRAALAFGVSGVPSIFVSRDAGDLRIRVPGAADVDMLLNAVNALPNQQGHNGNSGERIYGAGA